MELQSCNFCAVNNSFRFFLLSGDEPYFKHDDIGINEW